MVFLQQALNENVALVSKERRRQNVTTLRAARGLSVNTGEHVLNINMSISGNYKRVCRVRGVMVCNSIAMCDLSNAQV